MKKIFGDAGLRFIFSTRSGVPDLLTEDGKRIYGDDYKFVTGKDEVIREGSDGYIVSFGETVYRALDAVIKLKAAGSALG